MFAWPAPATFKIMASTQKKYLPHLLSWLFSNNISLVLCDFVVAHARNRNSERYGILRK
uniref:Uncharacterized protein n=1 Tax=Physcomitrium patens TaxID=3218 RepID=A0A2K1IGL3_PHYPA|nr:hypothetical protein PHYPA_029008 [Physcomitrium patens]